MKVYKIRNPQGLHSTGGSCPRWTKNGKTWVALNHLKAHLTLLRDERTRFQKGLSDPRTARQYDMMRDHSIFDKTLDPYVGCTVVELTMMQTNQIVIQEGKIA